MHEFLSFEANTHIHEAEKSIYKQKYENDFENDELEYYYETVYKS